MGYQLRLWCFLTGYGFFISWFRHVISYISMLFPFHLKCFSLIEIGISDRSRFPWIGFGHSGSLRFKIQFMNRFAVRFSEPNWRSKREEREGGGERVIMASVMIMTLGWQGRGWIKWLLWLLHVSPYFYLLFLQTLFFSLLFFSSDWAILGFVFNTVSYFLRAFLDDTIWLLALFT